MHNNEAVYVHSLIIMVWRHGPCIIFVPLVIYLGMVALIIYSRKLDTRLIFTWRKPLMSLCAKERLSCDQYVILTPIWEWHFLAHDRMRAKQLKRNLKGRATSERSEMGILPYGKTNFEVMFDSNCKGIARTCSTGRIIFRHV